VTPVVAGAYELASRPPVGDPRPVVGLRWLALGLLAASPARADTPRPDPKQASQLFDEGRRLIAAKQTDAACEAFASSLALDPQVGTKLNLASCREQQGRFGEAHALYEAAASEDARAGKETRANFARQQLRTLESHVVRVRLQITNPAGTTVTLGGATIDPVQPQLVVPGTIVVEVTATGHKPFRVEKSAAAGSELTIDVPALEPSDPASLQRPGMPPVPAVAVRATAPRSHAYLFVGGAGALLGAGGVAVLVYGKHQYNDAVAVGDRARVSDAQRDADVATGLAIGAAAAIGIATILYIHGRPRDQVVVGPTIGNGAVGLVIGGPL
jgi:tetratricopeptide (TPR) repeat protein